jgi:hypothetical protein
MSVGQMFVGEMSVGQMHDSQLSVGQIIFELKAWNHSKIFD